MSSRPSAPAGTRPTIEATKTRATPGVVRSVRTIAVDRGGGDGARQSIRPPPNQSSHCVVPMIRYRFGSDDLLRTRFALSPLFEVVWSAHVLRRPARAPLHRPWVAAARARLPGLDCAMLDWPPDSLGGGGHVAGLLTPPPGAPPGAPP